METVEILSDKEKFYQCDFCEKTFNLECKRQTHIKRAHEQVKKFECEKCDASFFKKAELFNHKKRIHELNSRSIRAIKR